MLLSNIIYFLLIDVYVFVFKETLCNISYNLNRFCEYIFIVDTKSIMCILI